MVYLIYELDDALSTSIRHVLSASGLFACMTLSMVCLPV